MEKMGIPVDPPPYDQEADNQSYMGQVDDLLDLLATAHINDNPDNATYTDESQLWNYVSRVGYDGSPAEAKAYFTQGGNLPGPPSTHANYNSDDTISIKL